MRPKLFEESVPFDSILVVYKERLIPEARYDDEGKYTYK